MTSKTSGTSGTSGTHAYLAHDPTGLPVMIQTSTGTVALYVYDGRNNPFLRGFVSALKIQLATMRTDCLATIHTPASKVD